MKFKKLIRAGLLVLALGLLLGICFSVPTFDASYAQAPAAAPAARPQVEDSVTTATYALFSRGVERARPSWP